MSALSKHLQASKASRMLICLAPFALFCFCLAACSPKAIQPLATQPAVASATPENPESFAARLAWENSPHAQTYDLSKGPNTYCAHCHSPQNWDPAAVIDSPPNCVSCKFAFEPEMRVAAGNPPVAEADWQDIGCEVCHPVTNGVVNPEVAWLDVPTGYHETISSPTDLCAKCHTDTETLRHQRDLGTQAHVDFTCTSCHNAHSTTASCTDGGCHPAQADRTAAESGHYPAHAAVTCPACHDAAGLAVEPMAGTNDSQSTWVTLRTTSLLGRETTAPYQSHNLQRQVDCTRCHYPGNPWGLNPLTEGDLD